MVAKRLIFYFFLSTIVHERSEYMRSSHGMPRWDNDEWRRRQSHRKNTRLLLQMRARL